MEGVFKYSLIYFFKLLLVLNLFISNTAMQYVTEHKRKFHPFCLKLPHDIPKIHNSSRERDIITSARGLYYKLLPRRFTKSHFLVPLSFQEIRLSYCSRQWRSFLVPLRCLVRALSAPFYGDSFSIPFIYVFILGSFYSSGLPCDFQKAFSVSFRSSYSLLSPSFPAPSPFNPPILFNYLPLSSCILFPPPLCKILFPSPLPSSSLLKLFRL